MTLQEQLAAALKAARDVAAKAEAERREFTDDERADVQRELAKAAEVKGQLQRAAGDGDLRKQIEALGGVDLLDPAPTPVPGKAGEGATLGARFVESPEFKSWLAGFGGRIPEEIKGLHSPAVRFPGFKALFTGASDTSAGALVQPDVRPLVELATRPLVLRDLVTAGQTGSDLVKYPRELLRTNNAAPVAEATSDTSTSGTKPQSIFTFTVVDAAVKTLAHWVAATKRAMSDAGQLRTLIDNFLETGLEEELEDQMIAGDGTGENFVGLLNVPGTQAQPFVDDLITTTRKALTKVRTVGRARPTAWLLNPADNERFDLLREDGATRSFIFGGPGQQGIDTLWRRPRIDCEAMPEGTGLVGDFRQAVLWDREEANIAVSDSHENFFVRNLLAIRGEMRAAFGVLRPAAFVEVDLTAGV